jgi:3-isopropylmalate/(R)-2-methylmalate dehydratase small subunit
MEPFSRHTGVAVVLDRTNVDTDQIVPKRFLKSIERTGFADALFADWRFDAEGRPRPDFPLNLPRYRGASVLVAGANFGSGSSREHAPWALHDYGIRAIIAPSFADIFRGNCVQNGLVPAVVDEGATRALMAAIERREGATVTVDLVERRILGPDGFEAAFAIDEPSRQRLLAGADEIALTLRHEPAIAAYERRMAARTA